MMTKKNIIKATIGIASMAILSAAVVVASCLCSTYYSSIQAYMQRFASSDSTGNSATNLTNDEAYTQALQTCEKVESEGLTLLKNDNDTLPLASSNGKINLFGYNSYKTVYTDYGSGGHHNEDQNFNFIDGFEFAGLQLNSELTSFYKDTAQKRASQNGMTVSDADFNIYEETLDEYTTYDADIWTKAANYSDTAVYVIGRMAGEGSDCPLDMGSYYGGEAGRHYLQFQPAEEAVLAKIENTFSKVIVIIDASNQMDLGFLDSADVDAAIWAGGPGSTGTIAVGKALLGEYNPSGYLPDTYAYDVTSSTAYQNLGNFPYSNIDAFMGSGGVSNINHYMYYHEGIYVGYRYYETRYIGNDNVYSSTEEASYQEAVQYPFGYGLSYTEFERSDASFDVQVQGKKINVSVKVKNTGSVAGKDFVELYYTAPYTANGIEKSAVVLGAFVKTKMLDPNETETVTMTMNFDDMSSYDYKTKKAYVLDSGDYILSLRSDAHSVKNDLTYTYNQNSTIVYDDTARSTDTTAATNLFDDDTNGDGNINTTFPYLSINDWEGTFPNKTKSSNLKASDSVVALLNDDSHGSTIDLDNDPTVDATFKQGVENGVILDSVDGITDPESSLWDDLVDHMSIDEMN